MGLSRNKVSLRERGDGSPPFYGERRTSSGARTLRPGLSGAGPVLGSAGLRGIDPSSGAGFLRRVLGNRAKHFGRSFCRGGEAILRRVRGSRERTGCAGLAHLCRRAAERIDSRSRRGDPAERGQGVQWMPWHWRTMKDARYCEKPRGAVSGLRSAGIRMGEPGRGHTRPSLLGREDHPGNRNIQVPGGREREFDSVSSGERKRISPNRGDPGYGPPRRPGGRRSGRAWKGPAERVTPPYARAEDPGRAVPE